MDGFIVAQHHLAHIDKGEMLRVEGIQQASDLVGGGQDAAEAAARLERLAHLGQVIVRIGHIQEQGVYICFFEAFGDIAGFEGHAFGQTDERQVFTGQVLHFGALVIGVNLPLRANAPGQGGGQGAGAGAGFQHTQPWADPHGHQYKADILGIHNLRVAASFAQQIVERRLQHEVGTAQVAVYPAAPGLAD